MKYLILSFLILCSLAKADGIDDYVTQVNKTFKPTSVRGLMCGALSVELEVHKEVVTVHTSSGNAEYDDDARRAALEAARTIHFTGWMMLPITFHTDTPCSGSITVSNLLDTESIF